MPVRLRALLLTVLLLTLLAVNAHAQAVAGCVNGRLVDPRAYFLSLVAGQPVSSWQSLMPTLDPALTRYGIWQQRTSGGEVRGRLFLPYDAPGYIPGSPFYLHAVDVVSSSAWVWEDRGGPAYAPFPCGSTPPPPPPPPPPDLTGRVEALERDMKTAKSLIAQLTVSVDAATTTLDSYGARLSSLETRTISCRAAVFGVPVSCSITVR